MKRRRLRFGEKKRDAPVAVVTFGGALLCFCFISAKMLVITVAVALIVLGIWLLFC